MATMAYTLFNKSFINHASAPSPNVQLPAVVVFPPEEEQYCNPPWCLLDSKEAPDSRSLSSLPDIDFLDAALNALQQKHSEDAQRTPPQAFCRSSGEEPGFDVIMPKRKDDCFSASRLEDVRSRDSSEKFHPENGRNGSHEPDVLTSSKTSASLKSRASKALQSFKIVGKGQTKRRIPVPARSIEEPWEVLSSECIDGDVKPALEPSFLGEIPFRRLSLPASFTQPELFPASLEGTRAWASFDSPSCTTLDLPFASPPTPPLRPPSPSPDRVFPLYGPKLATDRRPETPVLTPTPAAQLTPPRMRKISRFSIVGLHGLFSSPASRPTPNRDAPRASEVPLEALPTLPSDDDEPLSALMQSLWDETNKDKPEI